MTTVRYAFAAAFAVAIGAGRMNLGALFGRRDSGVAAGCPILDALRRRPTPPLGA